MNIETGEHGRHAAWRSCIAMIRGILRSDASAPSWPASDRARLISDVCNAIRLGFFDEAYAMLDSVRANASGDAAWLNLVGVVHEWRGEWKMARRFYGRAIRTDGRYGPAQQNMRRLYELKLLGRCVKPVALGDEVPALIALLRATDTTAECEVEASASLRKLEFSALPPNRRPSALHFGEARPDPGALPL